MVKVVVEIEPHEIPETCYDENRVDECMLQLFTRAYDELRNVIARVTPINPRIEYTGHSALVISRRISGDTTLAEIYVDADNETYIVEFR